ncbi:MAG: glutamate synthase [Clostridiaceae bacterium]|jgi:glutamate synthase domain-containing protein 3|nr:glutamate synthase [Clostridiaceae bacterium]
MKLNAKNYADYKALNEAVRAVPIGEAVEIDACCGERYIGVGAEKGKNIVINGIPGNAMGAYLDGGTISVHGNAQDATGDTMNDGQIVIYGNCGDAVGYGMRGGKIFIRGNTGYRSGIHMKAYQNKSPVLVVGGSAGSFLGEYQAGGLIIVLGLNNDKNKVGYGCATGMHGGCIYIRCDEIPDYLPQQISAIPATEDELNGIKHHIREFAEKFGLDFNAVINHSFLKLTPNSHSPYRMMYTHN